MATSATIGCVLGLIYALIAIILVFTYEATGLLNFALGSFGMVAAYCFTSLSSGSMSVWFALLIVIAGSFLFGGLIGVSTLPVQSASADVKATAAIALTIAAAGFVGWAWGTSPRAIPTLFSGNAFILAGAAISWQRMFAAVIALVLGGALWFFLQHTRRGSAVRATAVSQEIARMFGVPTSRLWVAAWGMCTGLMSLAIIVDLPDLGLSSTQLTLVIITPMVAVVTARFRSIITAGIVAFGLGLAESLVGGRQSASKYEDLLPLALFVLVVYLRRPDTTVREV